MSGRLLRVPFYAICFLILHCCQAQEEWPLMVESWVADYEQLQIEPLNIAYRDNLQSIHDANGQAKQQALFEQLRRHLSDFSREGLNEEQQLEYDLLEYHLGVNEERLALEANWQQYRHLPISDKGLADIPNGKEWYVYHLHTWLDTTVAPDSLYTFGLRESDRVYAAMQELRKKSGLDSAAFAEHLQSTLFLEETSEGVEQAIQRYADFVEPQFKEYFPDYKQTPPVRVARGTDKRLSQVPAFYRNATFFYNLFDYPFNLRQVAFLYLHEANPGHHYEVSHRPLAKQVPSQSIFYSYGYGEGWAAYIEDLALELGWYRDIYDEYGKWEWDMIRSVRVVLDVGLNYYGWTDEKALRFWNRYLPGQDDIAQREIARMKRWPAQVISYKYGSQLMLSWKDRWLAEKRGSLLEFHQAVLQHGPLPFSILERLTFKPQKS
ncbi:MAG: DUF885 domain-containing protein [Bacteroidota bacterium]